MNPRQAFFACLQQSPPALFEAALWIAVEHDKEVSPEQLLQDFKELQQRVSSGLPLLPVSELGQPLLRRMNDLGFQQDEFLPLRPQAALLDKVLHTRRGQPLALGLIALELARRLEIPMVGVNFPGHFYCACPAPITCSTPAAGAACTPTTAVNCWSASTGRTSSWPPSTWPPPARSRCSSACRATCASCT